MGRSVKAFSGTMCFTGKIVQKTWQDWRLVEIGQSKKRGGREVMWWLKIMLRIRPKWRNPSAKTSFSQKTSLSNP